MVQRPRVAAKLTSLVSIVFDLGRTGSATVQLQGPAEQEYLSCPVFDPRRITQRVIVM